MIPAEIKNRLKKLVGKTFMVKRENAVLLDWEQNEDQDYVLHFDNAKLVKTAAEMPNFLTKELLPVEAPAEAEPSQVPAVVSEQVLAVLPDKSMLQTVNDTLLDALKKVNSNPSFIPQAKGVSQIAQTIFNGAKLQIEAAKLLQRERSK